MREKQLCMLKISELKKRAKVAGVDEARLDEADNKDDSKHQALP